MILSGLAGRAGQAKAQTGGWRKCPRGLVSGDG